jgi:hypothetical protein
MCPPASISFLAVACGQAHRHRCFSFECVNAALIVSICSALFVAGGVFWQVTLYRLSGARLKVELVFAFRHEGGTRTRARTLKPLSWANDFAKDCSVFGIEYGLVRVTNIGRTPVSVENISFDTGRVRWFSRGRYTVRPPQFMEPGSEKPRLNLEAPVRLEPGDNVTVGFLLWPPPGIPGWLPTDRDITVRGSAHAVGRRRATRSARRFGWWLPKNATSAFEDVYVNPEIRVYRVLWRYCCQPSFGIAVLYRHRQVINQLREGKSHYGIQAYLDANAPNELNGFVAFDVFRAFHQGPRCSGRPGRCSRVR